MRTKLKLVAVVILSFVFLANCKKTKSSPAPVVNNSIDTNMAGMRTWQQMQVSSNADSAGVRHHDTAYVTIRTQVVPLTGTTIIIYGDSAAAYASGDTLHSVPSNVTGVISFTKTVSYTTGSGSGTNVYTTYDSVSFNYYGVYSMQWYELNVFAQSSGIRDTNYTISHTP